MIRTHNTSTRAAADPRFTQREVYVLIQANVLRGTKLTSSFNRTCCALPCLYVHRTTLCSALTCHPTSGFGRYKKLLCEPINTSLAHIPFCKFKSPAVSCFCPFSTVESIDYTSRKYVREVYYWRVSPYLLFQFPLIVNKTWRTFEMINCMHQWHLLLFAVR